MVGARLETRLQQEIQSSGLDMSDLRGVLVIHVEKSNKHLGYTMLEFRRKVWARNINFRVISMWLAFEAG